MFASRNLRICPSARFTPTLAATFIPKRRPERLILFQNDVPVLMCPISNEQVSERTFIETGSYLLTNWWFYELSNRGLCKICRKLVLVFSRFIHQKFESKTSSWRNIFAVLKTSPDIVAINHGLVCSLAHKRRGSMCCVSDQNYISTEPICNMRLLVDAQVAQVCDVLNHLFVDPILLLVEAVVLHELVEDLGWNVEATKLSKRTFKSQRTSNFDYWHSISQTPGEQQQSSRRFQICASATPCPYSNELR